MVGIPGCPYISSNKNCFISNSAGNIFGVMMRFNRGYFFMAVILFITEMLIALFVHDAIVRPYIGDVLVVILIYCTIRAFLDVPVKACALGVLLFAFTIELLQYFKIVKLLGLTQSKVARVVIGTSFAWTDLLAYMIGIAIVLVWERSLLKIVQAKY